MQERTPKVGETWTAASGNQYVCLGDVADVQDRYMWLLDGIYRCTTTNGLTPPADPLPEMFINIYAKGRNANGHKTRDDADAGKDAHRTAVLHLHPDGHTTIDRLDGRGEQ